ncbi:MAG: M4 family metallopeptidase [Myxococcota bacterium]
MRLSIPLSIAVGALAAGGLAGCEALPLSPTTLDPSEAEQIARDWLAENDLLGGIDALGLVRVDLDPLGMAHVRFQQTAGGLDVTGGQIVVHLYPSGAVASATDRALRDLDLDLVASIDKSEATDLARGDARARLDHSELGVVTVDGRSHLGWRVQLVQAEGDLPSKPVVWIDAHDGEELLRFDDLHTAQRRTTYDAKNATALPGKLVRGESAAATGDRSVDDAHDHAGVAYAYYATELGRDSWDGAGATIVSSVHYGAAYESAYWDGAQLVYGDGGTYTKPLSQSPEVVGHEFTHAVIQSTAGLIYTGESGALNEATADILGATIASYGEGWNVDQDTWRFGEDVAKPVLGGAIRYFDDPTADGASIGDYADYRPGLDVHHASGVGNRAFYEMVQDPALTIDEAAAIWYRALAYYMTPSTTFVEARDATIAAAGDLHGPTSAEVEAVSRAWGAVGVSTFTPFATETDVHGDVGGEVRFSFEAPAGADALQFVTTGTGDVDLYVQRGVPPTVEAHDCASEGPGSDERCELRPASAGTYHVLLHGYGPFSNVTLTVSASGIDGTPEVCGNGVDDDLNGEADCDDAACDADLACPVAGEAGSWTRFEIPTPEGATALTFTIADGTGDADLYVELDRNPTTTRFDCRPRLNGNSETCVFDPPEAGGVYHVALYGRTRFSGVALTASTTFDAPVSSGKAGDELRFAYDTPVGASSMTFALGGGTGDADLYVRFGAEPTTGTYDCAPQLAGNTERCTFDPARAGRYFVLVRGHKKFDDVALTVIGR